VQVYNRLIDELEYFLGQDNDEEAGRQRAAIINRCNPAAQHALKAAMEKAHARLIEYYSNTWAGMYAVALILDPSSKMEYYEDNDWCESAVAHAKGSLMDVIEEYGRTPEAATVPQLNQASSVVDFWNADINDLRAEKRKRRRVEKEGELERYLAADTIDTHADILQWWKQNAQAYPCLARIARDYLAIPATSAPAERVFSGGVDLVPDKRGSLDEETIRMSLCLDSWR
jgi:hAT family C-terminal dimerisation region